MLARSFKALMSAATHEPWRRLSIRGLYREHTGSLLMGYYHAHLPRLKLLTGGLDRDHIASLLEGY